MRRYYTGIMRGRVRYSSRWGLGARMSVGGGGVRGGVVTWPIISAGLQVDTTPPCKLSYTLIWSDEGQKSIRVRTGLKSQSVNVLSQFC